MSDASIANQPIGSDVHVNPADPSGIDPHTVAPRGRYLLLLSLTALGVVYGDIGTSVLYSMRECFNPASPHAIAVTPDHVFGVVSLIFWTLMIVVSVKYLIFVLEADNRGEGGILALTALATPIKILSRTERWWLVVLGIFGAALLYGDGIITPAITTLGAIEGINVVTPRFEAYVMPLTVVIIVGLFAIQSRGTATIGKLFGPVMVLWFAVLAVLGVTNAVRQPQIFRALNPLYGLDFLLHNGWHGFLILGSVFLVTTGGEALYADMGHFGKRPIRLAWFALVLPALVLNYFGQGALLISDSSAAENPFYRMAPEWAIIPLVVLATLAAIIASQALISGAFSLTMQAAQLGFLPRLQIKHTSETEAGQIYIPAVNWALMLGCIAIVVGFRTSTNLAAAYGIAVTSTMAITTIIFFIVARERWGWSYLTAGAVSLVFFVIDMAFFTANATKIPDGGWFPLVVAVVIFTVMTTWKRGRRMLATRMMANAHPVAEFMRDVAANPPLRVPGTAIFMSGNSEGTPTALLHNLEHNKVLHEQVVLLTVKTKQRPYVADPAARVEVETLNEGFYRINVNYGFMEDPDIPKALAPVDVPGLNLDPMRTTFFLGRENLIASRAMEGMALWREKLFAGMSRNATSATAYFCLPPNRVVELGSQVEI